jgi:thiamine biosynthesis lipoprotein
VTTHQLAVPLQRAPSLDDTTSSRRFRAMNTDVLVLAHAGAPAELLDAAASAFHGIEARFSRFLPDSELSRFNARASERVRLSREMLQLVELAQFFHGRTGGLFEPAILPQLEDAGYDRSFELVARDGAAASPDAVGRSSIADVWIDREHGECVAPVGLRIDFGGIGKGFAVDMAARRLAPVRDFLVDAGGDVFASGDGPDGDGWRVGVWDPFGGADIDVVTLRNEAVATSTTLKRRWRRGERWLHHIIDPRTGAPARSPIVSATVIAATTTEADVYAKCALMLDPDPARAFIESQRAEGLFVLEDGSVVLTAGWPGGATDTQKERTACLAD